MDEISKVLKAIDYQSFYQRHIQGFKLNGDTNVSCLCPFHQDKNPSLSINVETGLFNCFSCGEKGNAIQFVQKRYGLDFNEALRKVKDEEGIKSDSESNSGRNPKPVASKTGPSKIPKKSAHLTLDRVKLIHNQLMKNEAALKTFQDKYGLSRETIEKCFIGYQNEHYVIPIEAEPGKWTFKEHKGNQTKGAKVLLSPLGIIKEDLPYIIITEGEFKALLLNQLGFPAVSGTGGAGTWKKEWMGLFSNLNVIIAYDHDPAGQDGATNVVNNLKGVARSVKVIEWPSFMEFDVKGSDKKDVTDFFVTLGKSKDDFQRLIDRAREVEYEIKEIDGIRFVEPEGFKVCEGLVIQIIRSQGTVSQNTAFYAPLFITGRAIDVDLGFEDVEVAFKRDYKWKKIWVSKLLISDTKKIIELANHGLPVNSRNSGKMIEYLAAFEAFNMQLIPKTFVSKSFGFKFIEGKRVFILGRMVGKKAAQGSKEVSVEFSPEPGFERFVRAVKPEGTYLKWRECIEPALKYPYAAFAFYASFAAPLLRTLKSPNFIVDFWGTTSVGKTTVLELAASVWGNPYKESGGLVFGWDSTRVFVERMASFFCDIPIFPDDSQMVDNRTMESMLYQVVNGGGKGRGSVVGVRHTPTWHTVCFSTGERPLTECTNNAGARARAIELYGSPFPNAGANFINDFKTGIRENYGHAGAKFIEDLLPILDKPDELSRLKADYKMYHQALSLEANSNAGDRCSQYFAVVKLAADLVHQILGIGDPVAARESIDRVFANIVEDSLENVDIGTRAMEHTLSWINANEAAFKGNASKSFGKWKDMEYIGIYKSELGKVLKDENFSENAILRSWSEKGWIKREDSKFTCVREGKRLVIIPWNVITEFLMK